MSAAALTPGAPGMIDISGSAKVPFSRLTRVELRKMADTRAGFWLLVSIALITAAILVIFLLVAPDNEKTFLNFMGATATPQGFVLPVLGILLVTSEWGQRTALTTFALEPSRPRVIGAKIVAALLIGLAAIVVAVALAALATVIGGQDNAWENIGIDDFAKFGLLQISGILQGLAFGLLLLNSAAAIVLYFVLPIAFNIIVTLWDKMQDIAPWVDLGTSQQPLFSGTNLSGEEWSQLATSSAIWILLPLVVGLWRVMRAEVK